VTRAELEGLLRIEVDHWATMRYPELRRFRYPIIARRGTAGKEGFYQVEVVLLEDTTDYLHVSVAVDDGGAPSHRFRQAFSHTRMDVSTWHSEWPQELPCVTSSFLDSGGEAPATFSSICSGRRCIPGELTTSATCLAYSHPPAFRVARHVATR